MKCLLAALLLMALVWGTALAQTPLSKDRATQNQMRQALEYVYNHQFARADSVVRRIPARYAQHPALPMLQALSLQWKYMPLDKNPDAAKAYKVALDRAASQSEAWLDKSSDEPEAMFFAMMSYSMQGRYWAMMDESMKAVNATRKAYSYIKDGMELMDQYPEFYFSTGLYNYYRVRYPEEHPIYKAFLIFFPDGDKDVGIKQLDLATEKGLFTRYEALAFLANLYQNNENKPEDAYEAAVKLVKHYPMNPYYRLVYAEACLSLAHYNEAENQLEVMDQFAGNNFYKGTTATLRGVLYEKHYRNPAKAEEEYRKGLDITKDYAKTTGNFRAIAYAGMARLSAGRSQPHQAKKYYKQVEDLARSSVLKQEARRYLAKS